MILLHLERLFLDNPLTIPNIDFYSSIWHCKVKILLGGAEALDDALADAGSVESATHALYGMIETTKASTLTETPPAAHHPRSTTQESEPRKKSWQPQPQTTSS